MGGVTGRRGPARLPWRQPRFTEIDAWRVAARQRTLERMLPPDTGGTPPAQLQETIDYDGLTIERLPWRLPYGPPTDAYLLQTRRRDRPPSRDRRGPVQ